MLRLLTLNLQHAQLGALAPALAGPGARDPRAAREVLVALAGQLAALGPDVIALQEVDLGQARSGRLNQVAELASALGWTHHRLAATYAGGVTGLRRRPRHSGLRRRGDDVLGPALAAAGRPLAGFGNALISRYPVAAWHVRRLGRGPALLTRRGGGVAGRWLRWSLWCGRSRWLSAARGLCGRVFMRWCRLWRWVRARRWVRRLPRVSWVRCLRGVLRIGGTCRRVRGARW